MSILVNKHTRVILQGGCEGAGPGCSAAWRAGGHIGRACIVAGVPYGPIKDMPDGVPLFESMRQARASTGGTASVICVPPAQAARAMEEALDAQVELVICLTEGVPDETMQRVRRRLRDSGTRLLGPSTGLVTPGEIHIGPMPGRVLRRGRIGVVSRSSSLVSLAASQLATFGLGQSTVVGLGEPGGCGLGTLDVLRLFDRDPGTDAVLLAGSLDARADADCAHWIERHMRKPVVVFGQGPDALPKGLRGTRDPAAMGELVAAAVEPQWLPFD